MELIFPRSTLAKFGNARGTDGGMTGVVTDLEGVEVTGEVVVELIAEGVAEGVAGLGALTVVGAGAETGAGTGGGVVSSGASGESEPIVVSLSLKVGGSTCSFLSSTTSKKKNTHQLFT